MHKKDYLNYTKIKNNLLDINYLQLKYNLKPFNKPLKYNEELINYQNVCLIFLNKFFLFRINIMDIWKLVHHLNYSQ